MWRYSRIHELDLDRFAPGTVTSTVEHGDLGRAEVLRGEDAAGRLPDLPEQADAITWLHHSLAVDPIVVDVPAGVTVREPIVVRHQGPADGIAAAPQLVVRLGEASAATVVELQEGGGAGLLLPATYLLVAPGRSGGSRVGPAARPRGVGHRRSRHRRAAGGQRHGGSGRVRRRLRPRPHRLPLTGRGASGTLLAAYFGDGDQTLDYRTFQDHAAPDTTSNLLFKGTVSDRSRSVYTGLIRVAKNARGTNAFQTNRNIKLSEEAWAESVPNLQIENNDVHCSHASAVGPIDEEQRFYLESRGVPTLVAERLIVAGFFAEVFDAMPSNHLRPQLDAAVAAKLTAVLA